MSQPLNNTNANNRRRRLPKKALPPMDFTLPTKQQLQRDLSRYNRHVQPRRVKTASYFHGPNRGKVVIDPHTSGNIKENLLSRDSYEAYDSYDDDCNDDNSRRRMRSTRWQELTASNSHPDMEIFKRSTRRPHLSVTEVDILQRIVVRENILIEIQKAFEILLKEEEELAAVETMEGFDGLNYTPITSLLDSLRPITVDIIECICAWRELQSSSNMTYLFRGQCYITKIAHDLDFLDANQSFVDHMNVEYTSNPFAYPGGGALIISESQDSLLNSYFQVGLMVGDVEMFRIRNCEKEIEACLHRNQAANGENNNDLASVDSLEKSNTEQPSSLKAIDPYAYAFDAEDYIYDGMEDDDYAYGYSGLNNSAQMNNHSTWAAQEDNELTNAKSKSSFRLRFANKRVLDERIANLRADRMAILRTEADINAKIDALKRKRFLLNRQRSRLATAEIGVETMSREVVSQHIVVQESVLAGDIQLLTARITDLEVQRDHWISERKRKKLLYQRLQDEKQADSRRQHLQNRVQKQLHERGMVATLELLSGFASKANKIRQHQLIAAANSEKFASKSSKTSKREKQATSVRESSQLSSARTEDSFSNNETEATLEVIVSTTDVEVTDIDFVEPDYAQQLAYMVVQIAVDEGIDAVCQRLLGYKSAPLDALWVPIISTGMEGNSDAASTEGANIRDEESNYLDGDEDEDVTASDKPEQQSENEQLYADGEFESSDQDADHDNSNYNYAENEYEYAYDENQGNLDEYEPQSVIPEAGYEVSVAAFRMKRDGPVFYRIVSVYPNHVNWTINKSFPELKAFHRVIEKAYETIQMPLPFPAPINVLYPTSWHHMERADAIAEYFRQIFAGLPWMNQETKEVIATFVESGVLVAIDLPLPPKVDRKVVPIQSQNEAEDDDEEDDEEDD